MRITNANVSNRYIQNMHSNSKRLDKVNQEVATGTVINKISDDPYKAITSINLRNEISSVEKINNNATEVLGWTEHADSTLNSIGEHLSEIKTLLTSLNSYNNESEVSSVKKEIVEKTKQIAELFNSTYAGQKIFAGSSTSDKAVEIVDIATGGIAIRKTLTANNDSLKFEVSPGINISYNTTVDEITNNGAMFDTLNNIMRALDTMPIDFAKIDSFKEELDSAIDSVLDARSTLGARMNSIENMMANNTTNIEKMTETLSSIKDADIVEKAVELKSAELAYTASLQVGAKLLQNTILDYIR